MIVKAVALIAVAVGLTALSIASVIVNVLVWATLFRIGEMALLGWSLGVWLVSYGFICMANVLASKLREPGTK